MAHITREYIPFKIYLQKNLFVPFLIDVGGVLLVSNESVFFSNLFMCIQMLIPYHITILMALSNLILYENGRRLDKFEVEDKPCYSRKSEEIRDSNILN